MNQIKNFDYLFFMNLPKLMATCAVNTRIAATMKNTETLELIPDIQNIIVIKINGNIRNFGV